MRWSTAPKVPPRHGDLRTVYRFAWLPTLVGGMYVWLERYVSHQVFIDPPASRGQCKGYWRETARDLLIWYP